MALTNLFRKFANTLHEISIGICIVRYELTHLWNYRKGILIIHGL